MAGNKGTPGLSAPDKARLRLRPHQTSPELCKNSKACLYRDRCMFAHNLEEARLYREAYGTEGGRRSSASMARHQQGQASDAQPTHFCHPDKFKTQLCTFFETGQCRHGSKCSFAHGEHELRQQPLRPSGTSPYRRADLAAPEAGSSQGGGVHSAPPGLEGPPELDAEVVAAAATADVPLSEAYAAQQMYELEMYHKGQRGSPQLRSRLEFPALPGSTSQACDSVDEEEEEEEEGEEDSGADTSFGGSSSKHSRATSDVSAVGCSGASTCSADPLERQGLGSWPGGNGSSRGSSGPPTVCGSEDNHSRRHTSGSTDGSSVASSMRSVSPHLEGAATWQAANGTPRAAAAPGPFTGPPTPNKVVQQLHQSSEAGGPGAVHEAGAQAEADAEGSRFQGLRVRSEEAASPGSAAVHLAQLPPSALLPQQSTSAPVDAPPASHRPVPTVQPSAMEPVAAAGGAARASPGSPHPASASLPPPMVAKLLPRMPPPGFPASPPLAAPTLAPAPASPATRPAPYQPLAAAAAAPLVQAPPQLHAPAQLQAPPQLPQEPAQLQAPPQLQTPPQLPVEPVQLQAPPQLPLEPAQLTLPQQFQQLQIQAGRQADAGQASAACVSGRAGNAAQAPAEAPAAEEGAGAAQAPPTPFALLQRLAGTGQVDLSIIPAFVCPLTRQPFVDPVMAVDGYTYEKKAISDLFDQGRNVSPVTGKPVNNPFLLPNVALRQAMTQVEDLCRALVPSI